MILRYNPDEAMSLRSYGELPEDCQYSNSFNTDSQLIIENWDWSNNFIEVNQNKK